MTDLEYYVDVYAGANADSISPFLIDARYNVGILTFQRINNETLTTFQENIVQLVVCKMADFVLNNNDIINGSLTNYSINGVSIALSDLNVVYVDNIPIQQATYKLLVSSGLCDRHIW